MIFITSFSKNLKNFVLIIQRSRMYASLTIKTKIIKFLLLQNFNQLKKFIKKFKLKNC